MGVLFHYRYQNQTYLAGVNENQLLSKQKKEPLSSFLILELSHDIVVASLSPSPAFRIVQNHPEWFVPEESHPFDKRHVVEKVMKPLYRELAKYELLERNKMDTVLYIVKGDTVYQIFQYFAVLESVDFASSGITEEVVYPYLLKGPKQESIEEFLFRMIEIIQKKVVGPSGEPYLYLSKSRKLITKGDAQK